MPGLRALRVLVVDDNAQMRSIVGSVLTAAGVGRLYYAGDSKAAKECIRSRSVDAIYVDYEMPKVNGIDLIKWIRTGGRDRKFLPIVMLTGHSDLPRIHAARDAGADEFLCKPVTAASILKRLDALIAHQRPFVVSPIYSGPDRRRRNKAAGYRGSERRTRHLEPSVPA